jgi:hypothetical protein
MPESVFKNNFSAGELSPRLRGRIDLEDWIRGVKTCKNWIPFSQGPATTRPGTIDVAGVKTENARARMIPFKRGTTTAYVLEFGNLYFRVYYNNAGTYTRLGTVEVTTPYTTAQLQDIQFIQSNDILYLAHPSHAPRKILRIADDEWAISKTAQLGPYPSSETIPFRPSTSSLAIGAGDATVAGSQVGVITSATIMNMEVGRIIHGNDGAKYLVLGTVDTFILIQIGMVLEVMSPATTAQPTYTAGEWYMTGTPNVSVTPSSAGKLGDIISIGNTGAIVSPAFFFEGGWTSSGGGTDEYDYGNSVSEPTDVYAGSIKLTRGTADSLAAGEWDWAANVLTVRLPTGAGPDPDTEIGTTNLGYLKGEYSTTSLDLRFFGGLTASDSENPVGSFIRIHGGLVYVQGLSAGAGVSTSGREIYGTVLRELSAATATYDWTLERNYWNATDGYPSTVVFHQDRLIWGGSTGFPQTIWLSEVGDYESHSAGTNDADAFAVTLNAREVNEIEWLMSRQDLIVGTTEAEWAIQASGGILTPSDIGARLQTSYGSKSLRPVVVDGSILFFQRLGRKFRELTYDFNVSGYTAPEMSIIAEHITDGGIEEIAYQQSPFSIIWMVRSDGQLIGFTYDKKAGSIAWHRHVIGGAFSGGDAVVESVAVIPHPTDDYDELWMIVKRTINSTTSRRIEVLTKVIDDPDTVDPASYWQLDSGHETAITASDTITGLGAWEGETLTVFNRSDGSYLGTFTVSSGSITLSSTYTATMLTGYPYNCDLESNHPIYSALMGVRIKTAQAMLLLYNSLAGQAGRSLTELSPIQYLDSNEQSISLADADLVDPPDLISAWTAQFSIKRSSDRGGALAIRQDRPYPMTILAIKAEVD